MCAKDRKIRHHKNEQASEGEREKKRKKKRKKRKKKKEEEEEEVEMKRVEYATQLRGTRGVKAARSLKTTSIEPLRRLAKTREILGVQTQGWRISGMPAWCMWQRTLCTCGDWHGGSRFGRSPRQHAR